MFGYTSFSSGIFFIRRLFAEKQGAILISFLTFILSVSVAHAQIVDIADYLRLDLNSGWDYVEIVEPEVLGGLYITIDSDPGKALNIISGDEVTLLHLDTSLAESLLNNKDGFGRYEGDGSLYVYGFRINQDENIPLLGPFFNVTAYAQDVVFSERALVGEAGMSVPGATYNNTANISMSVSIPLFGNRTVTGTADFNVTYNGIIPLLDTTTSTFIDVLDVQIQIVLDMSVNLGILGNMAIPFGPVDMQLYMAEGIGIARLYIFIPDLLESTEDLLSGYLDGTAIVMPTMVEAWRLY